MPLIKRGIEPVNLSRAHVAPTVKNELEFVTNSTLANVIRQLSSLSKFAEDLFTELSKDANTFFHRANQLQERVDRLKVKVTQLDSTGEEVSLQDIHMRKPFKSSTKKDQQVITLMTRPESISEVYALCDAPPPLDKLNPYREDGKDSRKFYTDPTYFFELWCREIQKDTELTKEEMKKRKRKRPKPSREQHQIRQPQNRYEKMQGLKMGQELAEDRKQTAYQPQPQLGPPPGQQYPPNQGQEYPPGQHYPPGTIPGDRSPSRPSSLEIHQHNQYLASQKGQSGYGPDQGFGEVPPPYNSYPDNMGNGPLRPQEGWDGSNAPGYTHPPPYNYNHEEHAPENSPAALYNNNHTKQYGVPPDVLDCTPQHTPSKHSTPGSHNSSVVSSPRPVAPPPAPPGVASKMRESLPPPPPPPPVDGMRGTPPFGSPSHIRDSPARYNTPSPQHTGSTKTSTPDSMIDIPPPPPPPPLPNHTPDTPNSMPPPPPTPPPPEPQHLSNVPPAPPPPPIGGFLGGKMRMPNGDVPHASSLAAPSQTDAISNASNASSNTVSSGSTMKSDEAGGPVRDNRCDLLAAIRTGIDLRKVEEKRHKEQQRKHPNNTIDVQSIMEAAFEARRKALEANDDSGDEDDQDDEAWSDDDT